jgi:hypothetical protein
MLAALRLLERADGPVLIEDFPEDDPRARPDPGWRPPPLPMAGPTLNRSACGGDRCAPGLTRSLDGSAGPHHVDMPEIGRYVSAWLSGTAPASPCDGYSAILALRFAVDDLKAYYLEAAACAGAPSSRQLGDWLWNDTAASAAVIALRALGLASDDGRLKAVLGNFMVPAVRVAMMGEPGLINPITETELAVGRPPRYPHPDTRTGSIGLVALLLAMSGAAAVHSAGQSLAIPAT